VRVTTGTGDRGWTELLFGRRVRKEDPRIEAVGALDELNSWLGLVKSGVRGKELRGLIHSVQRDLFIVSSEFVCLPRDLKRLEFRVDARMVARLEKEISGIERRVKLKECCFLIPGENRLSAQFDICRCIARRTERTAVALRRKGAVPNRLVFVYLNRLSDLLYMLARDAESRHRRFIARERRSVTLTTESRRHGERHSRVTATTRDWEPPMDADERGCEWQEN